MIRIDFETRSAADLRKTGAYKYSVHESTHVLCLVYKIDDAAAKLWHRAHPTLGIKESPRPHDLIKAIKSGMECEAHNASFEDYMWENFRREFKWVPKIKPLQWRCSAAKCAALSLPRKLETAAIACDLSINKDMAGHRLMLKLSKPRKARKAEKEDPNFDENEILYYDSVEEFQRLWAYCLTDVETEYALSNVLRALRPLEQEIWHMDQLMNKRGITCDLALAHRALELAEDTKKILNARIKEITSNRVPKGSSREKLKKWVNENNKVGLKLEDTQGKTVEKVLDRWKDKLSDDIKEVLNICLQVNRTSTAKYKSCIGQASDDVRMRDTQLYHGGHTGRWTAKGLQLHNLVRGYGHGEMEAVCEDIMNYGPEELSLLWDNPMDMLAKAVRGVLIAGPGKELHVADYAAIEARVLLWLVGDEKGLDIFRRGDDIYKDMAATIYKKAIALIDDDERFIGKQTILGLGYQMGADKFLTTILKYDEKKVQKIFKDNKVTRPLAFCKKVVKAYRDEKFPLVKQFWYDTEEAAIEALRTRKPVTLNKLIWFVKGRFLHCKLPSGRLLSYYKPMLRKKVSWMFPVLTKDNEETNVIITTNPNTSQTSALRLARIKAEDANQKIINGREPYRVSKEALTYLTTVDGKLVRNSTYGGKEVENITQAVARDLLAEAALKVEAHPIYDLLFLVHDELVAEADKKKGSIKEFEKICSYMAAWAEGFPMAIKGWTGHRFLK